MGAGLAKPKLAPSLERIGAATGRHVAHDERRDRSDRGDAQADDLHRLGAIVLARGQPESKSGPDPILLAYQRYGRGRAMGVCASWWGRTIP